MRRIYIPLPVVGLCILAGVLVWLALQADLREASAWLPGSMALTWQLLVTLGEWTLYSITVALLVRSMQSTAGYVVGTRIFFVCTAANYLLPLKPGIPLRLYLYRRILQIPYAAGCAVLLLEGAFISGIPLVLTPVALWYLQVPLQLSVHILLGIVAAAALSILLVRRRPARRRLRFVRRVRLYLARPFRHAWIPMWICVLLQPLALLMYALRLWLILLPFGTPVALPALWAIAMISITAGRLSMLPMGVGVLDLSIGLLLSQAGASPEAVLAAVALNRLWISLVPLLAGLASSTVLRRARTAAHRYPHLRQGDALR